ncbi:MAG: biotin/lipoyl-containing protein [Dehalococcoidia bacterium]
MASVTIGGRTYEVEVRGETVVVDGHEYPVSVKNEAGTTTVTAGGVPYRVQLPAADERASGMQVQVDYRPFTLEYEGRLGGGPAPRERKAQVAASAGGGGASVKGGVTAQIAGRVISIKVNVGDAVAKGDVLLLLEAMKMENEIKSPTDGIVKDIPVAVGDRVSEGQVLAVVELD